MTDAAELAGLLRAQRWTYQREDGLQQAVEQFLAWWLPEREVRLAPRDRIDLLVGRVGVECKVAGNAESVLRQLRRYAESDRIDALILVTSRAAHSRMPATVGGKPLHVVRTWENL